MNVEEKARIEVFRTPYLRGDTPKPFLPYADIRCHIVKVYLKTIRFDTLEIIFENTLFRKKKYFLFRIF